MADGESRIFRRNGVSYLRLPAAEPLLAATFYRDVFGWTVNTGRPDPSFEDGSGHVIGHFVSDIEVAGSAGVRPYVFVDDVQATLEKATAQGGTIRTAPYPEGDLVVATFADPAGNEIGVWQLASGS